MSRQNINWALIQLRLAFTFWQKQIDTDSECNAFVVDDTIKKRRGKKVQATSSHYDHNDGHYVMGQQILQLGIVGVKGFLPLLCQIFVRGKKAIGGDKEFKDKRGAIAKSFHIANNRTKHEMLEVMLKKALAIGFYAPYIIADAWFGTKKNITLGLQWGVTPIFMMKRNKSKYSYQGRDYTLKGLYRAFRKNMIKQSSKGYSFFSLTVDYNLSGQNEPPKLQKVKLIFSRAPKGPKNSWVVLLCADYLLEDKKISDIYSLRWSIECSCFRYSQLSFKEVKRYFGFLQEQTGAYETHYASIHLAALRYILIFHIYLQQDGLGFANIRRQLSFQMELLSFSVLSREMISVLINRVIDFKCRLLEPEFVKSLKSEIQSYVNGFLHRSSRIDPESVLRHHKAEKLGLLA